MKALPLSGSENRFTNRRWSTPKGIGNNNCYAYAVGDYEAYRWQKSIPGDRSGLSNGHHTYTHCTGLPKRVISDNPKRIYKVSANEKCKRGVFQGHDVCFSWETDELHSTRRFSLLQTTRGG